MCGKYKLRFLNDKGMTTIEACFIIPIIMAVILLLFGTGVYHYNYAVMSGAAAKAALKGSELYYLSNSEIVQKTEEYFSENIKDNLIFTEDPKVEVTVSLTKIEVNVTTDFLINKFVKNYFMNSDIYDKWGICVYEYAPRLNHSSFIRNVHILKNVVEKEKDK